MKVLTFLVLVITIYHLEIKSANASEIITDDAVIIEGEKKFFL